MDGEDEASWRCVDDSWCLLMMEMVRSLTAVSKREKGGDETGGGEDGGVSEDSVCSCSENREGVERKFK